MHMKKNEFKAEPSFYSAGVFFSSKQVLCDGITCSSLMSVTCSSSVQIYYSFKLSKLRVISVCVSFRSAGISAVHPREREWRNDGLFPWRAAPRDQQFTQ